MTASIMPEARFTESAEATASAATLACLYEATAPKPGNVHPAADFDDVTCYAAFVKSAVAIGPILGQARVLGVGQTMLEAVRATRNVVGTNTNLGTLLLLAPLAAVPAEVSLVTGIGSVLECLTATDTRLVYEAIRLSQAGGLGRTSEADVFDDAPTVDLVSVMRLARDRDLIARQYVNAFANVLGGTAAWIAEGLERGLSLSAAIVYAHVHQLAAEPDSLIQRKCGPHIAQEASAKAAAVVNSGMPTTVAYKTALDDLDDWLRADGHRRNPGTTADLIAAGLFVLLREGRLNWSVW
jgi:triphosphoribosyl-dephospho-CoA synthase